MILSTTAFTTLVSAINMVANDIQDTNSSLFDLSPGHLRIGLPGLFSSLDKLKEAADHIVTDAKQDTSLRNTLHVFPQVTSALQLGSIYFLFINRDGDVTTRHILSAVINEDGFPDLCVDQWFDPR